MATAAPPVLEHHGEPIQVSIFGAVIDEFGSGVQSASVNVLYGDLTLAHSTSKQDGQFSFADLEVKVGFHSIRASCPDYDPAEERVALTHEMNGSSMTLVLRLQPKDLAFAEPPKQELPWPLSPSDLDQALDQACEVLPDAGAGETVRVLKSTENAKYVQIRVFFATDRSRQIYSDPREVFANLRSPDGVVSFGLCDVSIPNRHRIGQIETPSIFKFQFREDPNKHIILKSCEVWEAEKFYEEISASASASSRRDVFFFVHGYCVTFPEAIQRTAQMAFDLDFSGAPVCFSWPSQGKYSGYPTDEASIEWSIPHLFEILQKTAALSGVKTIHLIAHSMGNRALVRCLEKFAGTSGVSGAQFSQIIMAAPDIDADVFLQLADAVTGVGKRTTMYVSSNDAPLKMSKQFHSYPRAGEIGDEIIIRPELDTVDASAVPADILGHSYYGKSRTVLSDVYELLKNGTPPPRFGLQQAFCVDKRYWIFRP